eukprot:s3667_g3.t1
MQAAYEEVLPCLQLEADRRPSRLDAVESIGSVGSEDSARVGQVAAAKLLGEVADAAPSAEAAPEAPKQVKQDVDAAAMVQSLKERLKMRPPSAGLTSVGTAELDLAAELVHAACTAAETPPDPSSVAMSQATVDDDATAALQSVQEGLQVRPLSAGTRSFPASSLVEAAMPLPSSTGPASEERVQVRPPSAGTGSFPLSSLGEAADAQVVADVLEAAMPPSMTGPASEVEQGSSETEPRGKDTTQRDRPASPGLEPGVISVIASATCSEAAEAAVRAAYEEVLRPSLELEPGRRPSGFGLPESIASVGSEEAARLGAAAAADLLEEATDLAPSGAASVRTASSWEERITTEVTGDLLPDTRDHERLVGLESQTRSAHCQHRVVDEHPCCLPEYRCHLKTMVPSTEILEQQPTNSRFSADVEAAKHQFERCESSASTEAAAERFPRFSSDSSNEEREVEVSPAERLRLEREEHDDEKAELFREVRATPVIALLLLLLFVCWAKPMVLLWVASFVAVVAVLPNVVFNLHLMLASREDL